jgi:hypothetical protein
LFQAEIKGKSVSHLKKSQNLNLYVLPGIGYKNIVFTKKQIQDNDKLELKMLFSQVLMIRLTIGMN